MSRLELIALFSALKRLNDNQDQEGLAEVLNVVLEEAKRDCDDD